MSKSVSFVSESDVPRVAAGLMAAKSPFASAIVIEARGSKSARTGAKAGIALGARTPEEIALSVISEAVLVRSRCKTRQETEDRARRDHATQADETPQPATMPIAGQDPLRVVRG